MAAIQDSSLAQLVVVHSLVFFFNDTATTEIYTLSLHDALPIFDELRDRGEIADALAEVDAADALALAGQDRKSTRLNSSHSQISYAVFCLKKKKKHNKQQEEHN